MNSYYWSYRNKVTNKLFGVVHMPAQGKKRGDILLSYLTQPFTQAPHEPFSNLHTSYWECFEIARLFSERGYEVDIINWNDKKFIPQKPYKVCVDIQHNLARLSEHLPKNCKKVMHIVSAYWKFQNEAEEKRLHDLATRRGITLEAMRTMPPSKNPDAADYLEGFGNKTIQGTYAQFNMPIFPIPISAVTQYDFNELKDISKAKKHFLWLGGGGLVHKGLDLLLETFASLPKYHLHICGPIAAEAEFVAAYRRELYETANIHTYDRIDVTGQLFKKIIDQCASIIYPSCSEGTSGAVVQAMHAGLVPLITPESGIKENDASIHISNPSTHSLTQAIIDFTKLPDAAIKDLSRKTWEFARATYTREKFSEAYSHFIDTLGI